MRVTTLSARIPLTKTIAYNAGTDAVHVAPYPMVKNMTSHAHVVATLKEFERVIREAAKQGHCLLKGNLDTVLKNESRADHSVDEPHEWAVFDFDKVDCAPTLEGALSAMHKYLPAEVQNVDAIVQLSASCFAPNATHLSCHIFVLLEQPVESSVLKSYFEHINLTRIKDEISLTDSCLALHFPLDRTVAVPSKLIYIAPPRCVGYTSEIKDAIHFIKGTRRKLLIPAFVAPSTEQLHTLRDELRDKAQLPKMTGSIVSKNGVEYLIGSKEACVIHDIRKSGDLYLRFNMNGGDSQAYYINLREPHIIGNFKGEPFYYTKDVAPDLYKSLTKSARALTNQNSSIEAFAFYCTNRNSAVYIGSYNRETDELTVNPSNESAAMSWMRSFGMPPMPLPHMQLVYDMHSNTRYEPGFPLINMYKQSDFIKEFGNIERIRPADQMLVPHLKGSCPVIYKTLYSITGDSNEAVLQFVHWLAYVFQKRTKPQTAWLLHGVEGTGKGTLYYKILEPLLGNRECTIVMYKDTEGEFNQFMEGKLMICIDECELGMKRDADELASRFRNWITEPTIQIRAMREGLREAPSNCAFILFANSPKPLKLPKHDRRYNVGERQDHRLMFTPNEYAVIEQGEELPAFAQILGELIVEDKIVKLSLYGGESKERIINASQSLMDRVIGAIKAGDGDFFFENQPHDIQMRTDYANKSLPIKEYQLLLDAMVNGTLNVLTKVDLYVLMRVVMPDVKDFPENPAQQKRIFDLHDLSPKPHKSHWCKRKKKTIACIQAPEWKVSDEYRQARPSLKVV